MENNGYADLYTARHSGTLADRVRNLILAIAYGQERDQRGAPSQMIDAASEWSYAALVMRDDGVILYPADGPTAVLAAWDYLRSDPAPKDDCEIRRNLRTRDRFEEIFRAHGPFSRGAFPSRTA